MDNGKQGNTKCRLWKDSNAISYPYHIVMVDIEKRQAELAKPVGGNRGKHNVQVCDCFLGNIGQKIRGYWLRGAVKFSSADFAPPPSLHYDARREIKEIKSF